MGYFAGLILPLLLGYALGSIPFGILLTRLAGISDLRAMGSGNIGATNVLRTGRKDLAALTLLLDMAKGIAAVLAAESLWPGSGMAAATGALLGHMWPLWLRFRGGKGIATLLGVMIGLYWPSALLYVIFWLILLALTRYSSVAGMGAAASAPVAAAALGQLDLALLYLGCAVLIWWKHRGNLSRLIAGTEPRVGRAKTEGDPPHD